MGAEDQHYRHDDQTGGEEQGEISLVISCCLVPAPEREKCFDDDKHADAEGMEIICMYMDMELNKHSKGTVQNWNL